MKTKLDLAHEWALVFTQQNKDLAVAASTVSKYAFDYADAMMAEQEKRKHPEIPDSSEWQPDWSQAPDWANWWAIDKDLVSFWHEDRPKFDEIEFYQCGMFCDAPSFNYQGNWQDSLRKRPK